MMNEYEQRLTMKEIAVVADWVRNISFFQVVRTWVESRTHSKEWYARHKQFILRGRLK